jgi:hypothetical protein
MIKYWCLNFDFYEKLKKKFLDYGLKNNLWLMQYQYNIQEKGSVTKNWNIVKEIQLNDFCVAYLKHSMFFATGKAISPRKPAKHNDNVQRTITDKTHIYNDGIIHYTDSSVFYEDLTGNFFIDDWKYGQRIDIESWENVNSTGIKIKGLLDTVQEMGMTCRTAAFQISENFYYKIVSALRNGN